MVQPAHNSCLRFWTRSVTVFAAVSRIKSMTVTSSTPRIEMSISIETASPIAESRPDSISSFSPSAPVWSSEHQKKKTTRLSLPTVARMLSIGFLKGIDCKWSTRKSSDTITAIMICKSDPGSMSCAHTST